MHELKIEREGFFPVFMRGFTDFPLSLSSIVIEKETKRNRKFFCPIFEQEHSVPSPNLNLIDNWRQLLLHVCCVMKYEIHMTTNHTIWLNTLFKLYRKRFINADINSNDELFIESMCGNYSIPYFRWFWYYPKRPCGAWRKRKKSWKLEPLQFGTAMSKKRRERRGVMQ